MPSRISQMRNGTNPQLQQQTPQSQAQPAQSFSIDPNYLNSLKAIMRSNNPSQLLANLAAQNPQVQQVLQMISQGGNPRAMFEQLARAKGIDPNQIIKQLMEE